MSEASQARLAQWQALKSAEAWKSLRGLLDSTLTSILEEAENETEALDAFNIVLRTLAVATSVVFDMHPLRPSFVRMDTTARNVGGDNPDAEYDIAAIDGTHAYLITGTRGTVAYVGFQVLGGKGMTPRRHLAYRKIFSSPRFHATHNVRYKKVSPCSPFLVRRFRFVCSTPHSLSSRSGAWRAAAWTWMA